MSTETHTKIELPWVFVVNLLRPEIATLLMCRNGLRNDIVARKYQTALRGTHDPEIHDAINTLVAQWLEIELPKLVSSSHNTTIDIIKSFVDRSQKP